MSKSTSVEESLIETIRVINKVPLFWHDHLCRLKEGCQLLWRTSIDEISFSRKDHFQEDGVYRLECFFRNNKLHYQWNFRDYEPWGENLVSFPLNVLSEDCFPNNLKIGHAKWRMSIRDIMLENGEELILLNENDHLIETSRANLFFVHDKKIFSPPISELFLNGIGRHYFLEVVKKVGFSYEEMPITKSMLSEFSSLLIVNSVRGIGQIATFEEYHFSSFPELALWNKSFYALAHEFRKTY